MLAHDVRQLPLSHGAVRHLTVEQIPFDDTAALYDALVDILSLTNGRRTLQPALDANTPFTEQTFDVKDGGDRVSVRHVAR
ncbi:hypothetical protein ABZX39_24520 [Streptomyces collinus]|uniref:hypothetical protein n=1 Tax=Streptomyces collinus TaxID=42684 RepID=UPI0033A3A617